jgi:hypothetical protein
MKTRVAINGFGRIGRNAFKIAFARDDIEVVAINDLTDNKTLAHLLKYDSNYGFYHQTVSGDEQGLIVNGHPIKVTAVPDPTQLPWSELQVDVVIESAVSSTRLMRASTLKLVPRKSLSPLQPKARALRLSFSVLMIGISKVREIYYPMALALPTASLLRQPSSNSHLVSRKP